MNHNEHEQIGKEITSQYVQALDSYCAWMKINAPHILLRTDQPDWKVRSKVFLDNFKHCHEKAVSELMSGQRSLDSHKLAAIAILSVMKSHPIYESRIGCSRHDNYCNETVAILLAHFIMLHVRILEHMKENPAFSIHVSDILVRSPFPEAIYDKMPPMHRFRLIIAHMNLSDEHFLQNVRILAYICYQLDLYQRMLVDGNDDNNGKNPHG